MRGKELDRALEELLAAMLANGETISRTSVQKRLKLSSRGTLVGQRGQLVDSFREKQLKLLDSSDSKYHRLTLLDRCKRLTEENKQLMARIDHLTECLQKIVANAEKYGLSPERIAEPLAPQRRKA